jgi:hypothetical protein
MNLRICRGLITLPSELNTKEGALEVADNVVIDADDTIESRRGYENFGNSFATASDRLKQLLVYKNRILRHYNNTLQFDSTGSGSFSTFNGSYSELESGLRIKGIETSGNFYFTTSDGIKKISARSTSELSTASGYITDSGGVKAVDVNASLLYTSGGFLPPQSKCAYRLVWGIRDNNNNLILGYPSSRFVLTNSSKNIKTPETFTYTFTSGSGNDYDGSTANRYLTFDSKDNKYFVWFEHSTYTDRPNDSATIGRTEIKVNIDGLSTSTQIAATTANAIANIVTEFEVTVNTSTITFVSLEDGEDLIDATSSAALTVVTATISKDGTIAQGQNANAEVTFNIPTAAQSTNYFYQLYRTAIITATDDQTVDDIDPGDEMNLVAEYNLTDAEVLAGSVTYEDITTETFRASGAFLYTNPITGSGILQANERPPVAKDLALFRNSTFYANTKTAHKKQFSLLGVSDFVSGTSSLLVGNGSGIREYVFYGVTEVSQIVTDTFANTTANSWIELNSARDERAYYVWFNKGSGSDPSVSGRIGIEVDISSLVSANDVATKLKEVIDLMDDFSATVLTNTVTITNHKYGKTTDIAMGSTPPGGSWAVSVTTQGDGEDTSLQKVQLSSLVSAGQSIDETARSLVKVINSDTLSPVNAYYLSGPDDLPGIILFEAKSLTDDSFYIAVDDALIGDNFNPEMPQIETLTAISLVNPTQITAAAHGLVSGDEVYIFNTDSTPALLGNYVVTFIDVNTFSVPVNVTTAGTTGLWFKSNVVSDNEETPNRVFYSKLGQPEAVPLVNYIDIGPKDQEVKRILALRDSLFVLKEDGVYIITGTTAPNFSARLLDGSSAITAPDTAMVLNNKIYCLTDDGIVSISESGVEVVSRFIENKIFDIANVRHPYKTLSFGVSYDKDRAYLIWMPSKTTDTVATQCYRYNIFTQTWTRWTLSATCGIVNNAQEKMYLGSGNSNYIFEERKNGDRTDYADISLVKSINNAAISGTTIELSNVVGVAVGDVLVQSQTVTISQVKRLLLKLDRDLGLDDSNYYSTLAPQEGDSLTTVLDSLNIKLNADDASGTITSRSFSNDFAIMQTQFNDLIGELNNLACDTSFKDYAESTGTVPVETIIRSVNTQNNKVTVPYLLPFVVGDITVYKSIYTEVQWAPQYFGSPEVTKQVREGTVIFDQNNFYSATVMYATDRSAAFEGEEFFNAGVGYWGGNVWGEGTWGGEGNEIPVRRILPKDKQRCRYVKVKYLHKNAREIFRILGISLEPRELSTRGYR